MLRLHQGNTDEAWQDLLVCHRLARLLGQGPGLAWVAVAYQVEVIALKGDQALLRHAHLTKSQMLKRQAELADLPSITRMADKIDFEERCVQLDSVTTVACRAPASIRTLLGLDGSNAEASDRKTLCAEKIDWDIVLRTSNSWYDRILAAFQEPTHAQRTRAMDELNDELQKMAKTLTNAKDKSLGLSHLGNSRKTISECMGQVFIITVSPAFIPARIVEESAAMQQDLTKTAFALAAYRADNGSYPTKLHAIVPKYVKQLPKDIFNNDRDLHYATEADGYLLYSVGSNGRDDGGRGQDDRKTGEDWDDLAVRISPAGH
jgi:hypothetical protein